MFSFKEIWKRLPYTCSRKNFVCLTRKLFWPLVSPYIFTQWGWRSHSARMTFPGKSNSAKARHTTSSSASMEQDGRISVCSLPRSNITLWGEPSNSWILESTLLAPGVPSWIWIRRINSAFDNSASSFLDNLFFFFGDLHASLLQQPGPRTYGWTSISVF